jgi:hypothetical protein
MQPSFAAEYPIADNPHTFYGGMLNCLGSFFGFIGSVSFTISRSAVFYVIPKLMLLLLIK